MFPRLFSAATAAVLLFPALAHSAACPGFGPQSPRDIDQHAGVNPIDYGATPALENMSLCNIHLHENAEHRAAGFDHFAGAGDKHGIGGGYQCGLSKTLSPAELKAPKVNHCEQLEPGDTVEVHWVFTSCDVDPGPGLGSCSSSACANPTLRVEAQVFTLVNDTDAMDFADLRYEGHTTNNRPHPKSLPDNTGDPVSYFGSTTGPKYDGESCSPLQVHWSVRPQCAKLDINSLSQWCASNVFDENSPHGVRKLVVNPHLLAPIE